MGPYKNSCPGGGSFWSRFWPFPSLPLPRHSFPFLSLPNSQPAFHAKSHGAALGVFSTGRFFRICGFVAVGCTHTCNLSPLVSMGNSQQAKWQWGWSSANALAELIQYSCQGICTAPTSPTQSVTGPFTSGEHCHSTTSKCSDVNFSKGIQGIFCSSSFYRHIKYSVLYSDNFLTLGDYSPPSPGHLLYIIRDLSRSIASHTHTHRPSIECS